MDNTSLGNFYKSKGLKMLLDNEEIFCPLCGRIIILWGIRSRLALFFDYPISRYKKK